MATYYDQFWIMDPYAPPPPGTTLTVHYFSVVDNNNNNLINRFNNDSVDGVDIRQVYPGDTVTVNLAGGGTQTITGATFYLADGRIMFTPIDGSTLPQNATLASTTWTPTSGSVTPAQLGPPCFTPGTLIETPQGPRLVETLRPGDLVETIDRGAQPIRLVHERSFGAAHLQSVANHRGVSFEPGALGQDAPHQPLVVSPQHRIMLRSQIAERLFGTPEIMVPAVQLIGWPGVSSVPPDGGITYIHLLLDHHAVLWANGVAAESLYLGTRIHETLTAREIDAIYARFPDLATNVMRPARLFVRGKRLRALLERHARHSRELFANTSRGRLEVSLSA